VETSASEEHATPIFRVEVKMETVYSSERLVFTYQNIRCDNTVYMLYSVTGVHKKFREINPLKTGFLLNNI
jgi:hypothetical protein